MSGKLFGILLMALAAILAWKWLRAQSAPHPPASRHPGQGAASSADPAQEQEKVIELEQDADGVYRPKDDRNRTKR